MSVSPALAAEAPAAAAPVAKVYFRNLNAVRFLAAFIVFIHHVEGVRANYGLSHFHALAPIMNGGRLGVVMFFSLSGFLITYLLLVEEKATGKVNIGDFYIRRILRIWPLYYLVVGIAFFVVPHIGWLAEPRMEPGEALKSFWPKLALFVFFLPNIALVKFGRMPGASQAWSVGTEEQFYLFWPWLVRKAGRHLLPVLGVFTVGYAGIQLALKLISDQDASFDRAGWVLHYLSSMPFQCMSIGGITAVLAFRQSPWLLRVGFHPVVQGVLLATTAYALLSGVKLNVLHQEVYAVLFSLVIVNLALNPRRLFDVEKVQVIHYLGKISYGFYMYHYLAIVMSIAVLRYFVGNVPHVALYLISGLLAVAMSAVSYELFEVRFIRLKHRFSHILSGETVRPADAQKPV